MCRTSRWFLERENGGWPQIQGPHSQISMTWVSDRGSYFIPKKTTTSEFVYPKKSLLFLAHPEKSLSSFFATQKNPSGFFPRPKKIPASFIDPKKNHFWPKFQTQKITRTPPPPVIKICEWSPCDRKIRQTGVRNKTTRTGKLATAHEKYRKWTMCIYLAVLQKI